MKKVICTVAVGEHQNFLKYIKDPIEKYADLYDFDVCIQKELLDENRSANMTKIHLLLQLMEDYDLIFFIDSDAIILRFDEDITNLIDDEHWIYICREYTYLNSGVMIFKRDPLAIEFLKEVLITDKEEPFWKNHKREWKDQSCILKLLGWIRKGKGKIKFNKPTKYTKFVKYIPKKWNCIYKRNNDTMIENPIIIHYAGVWKIENRLELMKNKKVIK